MLKLIYGFFFSLLLLSNYSIAEEKKEKNPKKEVLKLLDNKNFFKELDRKIGYYNGLLIEKKKEFDYLEKDEKSSVNTLIKLNKEIEKLKDKIYALKLKKAQKKGILKEIQQSLKFVKSNEISKDYKEAVKSFSEGNIQKAQEILNQTKINTIKSKIKDLQLDASNQLLLKANIYLYQNKIDKAKIAFKESIKTIETFSNTFAYGLFLESQNKLAMAETYFNKAKARYNSLDEYATVLNSLGSLYFKTNRYKKAERYYIASMRTFKKLLKLNKELYLPEVAIVLNNVGNLYYQNNRLDRAKTTYNQVLGIFEELNNRYKDERHNADIAMVLNNLGNLYHKMGLTDEAIETYKKSLKLREDLARENPAHNVELAMVLNNLGSLYYDISLHKKAEEAFKKSYDIRKKLAKINPEAYEVELAMGANNLGNHYNKIGEPEKAEKFHKEALRIYTKYARLNPSAYDYHKGVSLNNLALVYEKLNQKKKAKEYYEKALKIRKKLAKQNIEAYGIDLARTKLSYGFFIGGDQGEILIKEAITLLKRYRGVHTAQKLIEIGESMLKRLSIR